MISNKVILPSLNYGDIAPEVIANEVKLIRFTPTQTLNALFNGEVVRYILQSNGFYDPFSAYFRMTVEVPATSLNTDEIRFVDRSAHSFITRFIVRSQGIELERIEEYDTIAGIINDMLYSQEQN